VTQAVQVVSIDEVNVLPFNVQPLPVTSKLTAPVPDPPTAERVIEVPGRYVSKTG
jgi:hypothetical protein